MMSLFKIKLLNKKRNKYHIINRNILNKNNYKHNNLKNKNSKLILNFKSRWMIKLASSKINKML